MFDRFFEQALVCECAKDALLVLATYHLYASREGAIDVHS